MFLILIGLFLVIPHRAICVPIQFEDIAKFQDDWDYAKAPNRIPILESVKEHEQIQSNRRTAKEDFDSLQVLSDFSYKLDSGSVVEQLGDSVRKNLPCSVCTLAVGFLQSAVKRNDAFLVVRTKFVSLCVGFNIQNEMVCGGVFDVFGPHLLPSLNYTKMDPAEICRLCLGESCEDVSNSLYEWDIFLPPGKSPEKKQTPVPENGKPFLKVLHLSDTHYDPYYEEGSISNCAEPLCCRSNSSVPKNQRVIVPAGKWGAYDNCDSPKVLVENMLQNIAIKHPDIDYIIWTGDLIPHDIWKQDKNYSLQILKECVAQMKAAFPNIPILPALGNHEGIPAGSFPPPWNQHEEHSIAWLYEEVNRQWKEWLPESEENTILHGGFFSVLVRPGLRVISMNMNYCHSLNWWLLVNTTDPARELKWLVYQLQEAESNGEKVHIIGHIPPGGTDCLKSWSQNYYKIIERYENVITAQFFGHTHADEFEVFYDTENYTRPTGIAFIGPSVTPYSGQNPAYRIYYVDGNHNSSTWEVIDHETWIMDLEQANAEILENPDWFKLYSARNEYGLTNLRPQEWSNLIYKMLENQKIFEKFYRNYFRNSPVAPKYGLKEKLQVLCDLKSGRSQDRRHLCNDLEQLMMKH